MKPKPSFFIAGNSKGGTTALHRFLNAHPAIFMCRPKEPNYFARDFCRDPDPTGSFHPMKEAAYLDLFSKARPDQRCGEASACYLYSRVAAQALHAFDPSAKIIFILREPVDFLYSYYLQLLQNPVTEGERVKDFRKALSLETARRQGRHLPRGCRLPEFLYYSERVKYAEHLERFFTYFDRSQIKIIIYDDFKRDNEGTYRDVLAFLDVDPTFTPKDFQIHNRGAVLRSRHLRRIIHKVAFGEGWAAPLKPVLKRLLPVHLRRTLMHKTFKRFVFKPKQPLDPALVYELKQTFRDEVIRLSEFLGRDMLSLWGYVPLDDAPPYTQNTHTAPLSRSPEPLSATFGSV
ncbi:MAG: sulfotransferase [Rhodothermales bacterium]